VTERNSFPFSGVVSIDFQLFEKQLVAEDSEVVSDEFLTSLELLPSFASASGAEVSGDLVLDGFD